MGQSTRQVQVKVKLPDWPVTTGVTMKLPGNDMVTRSARRTCWFHVYPQHLAWRPTWQLYTTPQVDSQISLTFRKKQFMCTPPGESLVVWIIEWVHPSLIHGKQASFWRELRRGAYPEPQDNERRTNQNFSLPRYQDTAHWRSKSEMFPIAGPWLQRREISKCYTCHIYAWAKHFPTTRDLIKPCHVCTLKLLTM